MRSLARVIKAPPVAFSVERGGGKLRKIKRTIYVVRDAAKVRKFIKGTPVPGYVALTLTADKFHRSADGLRKAIAHIERAKAASQEN